MDYIRISAADNGYIMEYDDPEVRERNRTSNGWEDPCRRRVYDTPEALTADLAKVVGKLKQRAAERTVADDFAEAIDEAFGKGDD